LVEHDGTAGVVGVYHDGEHVLVAAAELDGDDLGVERGHELVPAHAGQPVSFACLDACETVGTLFVFVDADENDAAECVR
jgi:hypothetical protein